MDAARTQQIIAALQAKGVKLPCPRCGTPNFSVAGQGLIAIQENPNTMSIGGPAIPTAIVVCNNCGYVTEHALRALGILI